MSKEILITPEYLENKIYIIKGQKVMLDSDLAEIYGFTTKRFNEQVHRNIKKFDEDFMFQLNEEEIANLSRCNFCTSILSPQSTATLSRSQNATTITRCQVGTSMLNSQNTNTLSRSQNVTTISRSKKLNSIMQTKGVKGGRVYRPYVFTEQGIYMLMTVLKGDFAIKQSKTLIRLFKAMKDYLSENRDLLPYKYLEMRTANLEEGYKEVRGDLNKVMKNFDDPSTYKHFLILDGKKIEADLAYIKIFKLAKKSIYYIDDYIDIKTLDLLSNVRKNVSITIFSDNKSSKPLKEFMIKDFIKQNPNNKINLIKTNNKCHDRYIIIDHNSKNEMIFHSGASLKDAGNKITTITRIEEVKIYKSLIKKMLKRSSLRLC